MSDATARQWTGRHFDGRTPQPREALVRVEADAVVVSTDGEVARRWPFDSVVVIRSGGGGDPVQLELRGERTEALFVSDRSFLAAVRQANGGRAPKHLGGSPVGLRLAAGLAVAGALLLFTCWRWGVPALAAVAADHLPPAWEREFGAMVLRELAPESARVTDERVVSPVRDVFARLVNALPVRGSVRDSFDVTVTRARVANAFATPGGHVVVTTGLLGVLRGPDELAAVLAHEITHVTKRHTTRGLLERQGWRMLMGLAAGDRSALGSLLGTAGTLGELSYSRADEQEADDGAAELLARSGIPPRAMSSALESISGEREGAGPDLGFLSTHPTTGDRLRRARAVAARLGAPSSRAELDRSAWDAMKAALPSLAASTPTF